MGKNINNVIVTVVSISQLFSEKKQFKNLPIFSVITGPQLIPSPLTHNHVTSMISSLVYQVYTVPNKCVNVNLSYQ